MRHEIIKHCVQPVNLLCMYEIGSFMANSKFCKEKGLFMLDAKLIQRIEPAGLTKMHKNTQFNERGCVGGQGFVGCLCGGSIGNYGYDLFCDEPLSDLDLL